MNSEHNSIKSSKSKEIWMVEFQYQLLCVQFNLVKLEKDQQNLYNAVTLRLLPRLCQNYFALPHVVPPVPAES